MALVYKDRVKETTTTTGTGTLTLAGAASGYQAFSSVGDGNTCVYGLEASDGGWEVGIGTYTLSGTTLARTTILSSSNSGSAITLPAGTHNVYVTAESSALRNGFLRSKASSADAAVTGEVGTMHMLDIAAFSANRNFTLPAAVEGDRIGVTLTAGDATYALICIGDTGITINGGSAATEWSRLFISGESVIFRATSASNWVVEMDGRIPCSSVLTLTTDSDSTSTATWIIPTSASGVWTENRDVGGCMDHTTGKFTCRRAGTYQTLGRATPNVNISDAKYWGAMIFKSNTSTVAITRISYGATALPQLTYGGVFAMVVDDYAEFKYIQEEASKGLNTDSTFTIQELL